jgi:hypothetical protein
LKIKASNPFHSRPFFFDSDNGFYVQTFNLLPGIKRDKTPKHADAVVLIGQIGNGAAKGIDLVS